MREFQHKPPKTSDRRMQQIVGRKMIPREIYMSLRKWGHVQLTDTPEFQRTREEVRNGENILNKNIEKFKRFFFLMNIFEIIKRNKIFNIANNLEM